MEFKRMAGWAGIVTVVFFLLNLGLAGSTPTPEDSIAEITDYLAGDQGMHQLGLLFGVLAALPFVAFLAGILVPVFRSDREHGEGFGIVIFGGALLLGAASTIANTALGALLLRGTAGLDPGTVRGLWDTQQVAYGSGGIAFSIFGIGVALAVLRRHVMADWLGWLATVLAVAGALGLFTLTSDGNASLLGYIPFVLFLVWVLGASITMVRTGNA
jgi:hypothetical protein